MQRETDHVINMLISEPNQNVHDDDMLYMIRLVCACAHKLLRSVYSPQTLSSQLVLFKSHLATAQEHLLQL